MTTHTNELEQFEVITLDEMKSIHLMDRVDFKFVAPVALLPRLLEAMEPYFKVQIHNGKRIANYATQYLDTPDLDFYLMHQNGKLNRQKIRIRSYQDSQISFLEIKNKNNKGRTKKIRVPVTMSHIQSVDDLHDTRIFLDQNAIFDSQMLTPTLANSFQRITMVNNLNTERITIDVNLAFENCLTGKQTAFDDMVVLELKQDGWQHSDFRDILINLRIKQQSFSKYCMGTVMTNADVKYNRFKRKWFLINKITHNN
ncbi:MAG: polyphosphate polymerase domain-containing protein [Candidatus Symbiothrix sp.]|jgi:hypothetical protein|nr:polyphosphate polymerase domain-containing protein [Candidatus Symbiothrix sp.]